MEKATEQMDKGLDMLKWGLEIQKKGNESFVSEEERLVIFVVDLSKENET